MTVPRMRCPRCEVDVPAGNFCGLCGCNPRKKPSPSVIWLRRNTFGAAPGEAVLRPYISSALFPHLPSRARRPFRATLVIAVAGLIAAAILRLPALGITVGALGLPLLFLLYLRASAADRDLPRASLGIAAVIGVLLGTLWVLASGHVVARNYGLPMAVGLALHHLLREGVAIPAVGITLMVIPPLLVRLVRPGSREALDGFLIGALSALSFAAAATLTRLAPQLATGIFAHARPFRGLLVEAVLAGITVPLSAAAAGGMIGIALWFRAPRGHQGRVRAVLLLVAAAGLLAHAAVGVIDIIGVAQVPMVVAHLVITIVMLLGLRLSMQLALLHEAHDRIAADQPVLCPHCDHVVPDMAFCPACGAATRAASQQSRRLRRGVLRPQPENAGGYPGYALPSANYTAEPIRQPRFGWLLGRWGLPVMAVAVALGAVGLVLSPKVERYLCPPDCGKPPTGTPVMALPRFQAPDGAFSVAYPAPESPYTVTTGNSGVTAGYPGGVMQLFSEPANGRSAREVVKAILARSHPDAKIAYEIPNAMVGYQLGYGEIADDWPQGATASYSRLRILLMAAVKNDLALVAFATGPYRAFGPDFGPGPPSGANLEIAADMGKYVNSFRWKGDPDR